MRRDRYWQGRYGPWALIAGGSEGIGAAFATALARAGLNIVLIARRAEPLEAAAEALRAGRPIPEPSAQDAAPPPAPAEEPEFRPVQVRTVVADLATPGGFYAMRTATATLEIGMVVANAADTPVGRFLDVDTDALLSAIDLNCATTIRLAKLFLPAMAERRRGGFIVMSSLAGSQGAPGLATYAATKAFGAVLAEGLWAELHPSGVDVLACVAGAVSAPGPDRAKARRAPGAIAPRVVADTALAALGRRPRTVPGAFTRASSALMQRLLPRRAAISIISRAAR